MTPVTLVFISLVLLLSSIKTTTLTQAYCLPDQRDALIQLKQGFSTIELHSWNASTDCCIWDGIRCDEQSGMVIALNLIDKLISGEINPALFNLSSLRYLNLAGNDFHNLILPQIGFERLANLTHLDLSCSGFTGQVPIGISALTNLISLNLSYASEYLWNNSNTNSLYLHGTGLKTLLSNLTKLQALNLDGVDISLNGSEWGKAILQVGPTLQELFMADCGLRGNFPNEIFHLTNLTELDLSDNSKLSGQLSEFTKQSLLQSLYLSNTNLTGPLLDSIRNLQYLWMLALDNCSFIGEIPPSITNLTRLEGLDLGLNILTGTIPMTLFSHPSLISLDLSSNQLSGYLTEFSNKSSSLLYIDLEFNNLQGQLPISIFKLPRLFYLFLGSNNFNGTLNLDIIKHSKKLERLDLSNNKLSIIEGKNHRKSFYDSFLRISILWLGSCNLTKFPSFLNYQTHIESLDLSNNKINGVIPNWLWNNEGITFLNLSHNFFTKIEGDAHFTSLSSLSYLDIHSNRISGPVPLLPPGVEYVDFSSNYFFLLPPHFDPNPFYLSFSNNSLTGEIPLSICKTVQVHVVDLSYNNLTGTVPPCLLEDAEFREVLNLKSNQLSGSLPQNISQRCQLKTIDLSGNRINGCLPQSLMNCNNLEVLDLGNNQIVDGFPFWLGNLQNLRVLVLRTNQFHGAISNMEAKTKKNDSFFPALKVFDLSSNRFGGIISQIGFQNLKAMMSNSDSSTFKFGDSEYYHNSITIIWKGEEMEIMNSLSIFSSLDLSQNEFWGEIPEDIGKLKSLDALNLSHNALIGSIPSEFANLQQLESLDLSFNQLSGNIPQEFTSLTFLSALNLSYNKLVGNIPHDQQFATFTNASYLGNPGLCGSPLSMQCPAAPNDGFNKGLLPSRSYTDIIEFYVSVGLGLGVGFASVIWALISWKNVRERFNIIVDRLYFRYFH
ncbi:receptor-like protein 7 [Carex rostrata]